MALQVNSMADTLSNRGCQLVHIFIANIKDLDVKVIALTEEGEKEAEEEDEAQTKPDFNGPILGPKMAEENKREFTQEQLDAGKNVVSLQYGSNQGASQAGLSMGKQRMIAD
uniref:Uncharacterized protein n=1 Tax=Octopus bimaculoides TaxID=37653 RepID=A0A0L8IF68_OCTBM